MESPNQVQPGWDGLLAPSAALGHSDGLRFGESPEDCAALADSGGKPLLAPLPDRGALLLEGPDATRFLQGQFSCDALGLAVGGHRLGACCTPKGRVVANPVLWRIGEQRWLLALPRSAIAPLREFLARYLVFSRAELRDVSDELLACGEFGAVDCAGAAALADAPDSEWGGELELGLWRQVAPQWRELWLPAARAASLWTQLLASGARPVGEAIWRLKLIRQGCGEVSGQTSGAFLPQMLNLDALGGIDYNKGCYTGQEVVARAHFRGQLKRRLYRAEATTQTAPEPGTTLLGPDGVACGDVVCAAPVARGRWELLAVLRRDKAHAAQLGGNALRLLPLPYPLAES